MVCGCSCDVKETDSLKRKIWEMSTNTTMHGLPKVANSSMYLRKILWSLVLFAGLGIFIWQMSTLVLKYFSYSTSTSVHLKYAGTHKFPAVTFCNLNPIRKNALRSAGGITALLEDIQGKTPDTNPDHPDALSDDADYPDAISDYPDDYYDVTTDSSDHINDDSDSTIGNDVTAATEWNGDDVMDDISFFTKLDSNARKKLDFRLEYMSINVSKRREIGHSLKVMLLSCTFGGRKCGPRNFTHSTNYKYGNCFTFNSGTTYPEHMTQRTGPTYGLSLEIYMEQDTEYIERNADSAGIKLVIHNQTSMPFPEENGYSISPGTKTSVAITTEETERSFPPYGKCTTYSDAENAFHNVYSDEEHLKIGYSEELAEQICGMNNVEATLDSLLSNTTLGYLTFTTYRWKDRSNIEPFEPHWPYYRPKACSKTCLQKHLIAKCRCCSYRFSCRGRALSADLAKTGGSVPFCNYSVRREDTCANEVFTSFQKNTLSCLHNCKPLCSEFKYVVADLSSSDWPSAPHMPAVSERIKGRTNLRHIFKKMSMDQMYRFVGDNVLKIQVFYKTLNYETLSTQPSYSETSLLSDIGGQMGLWLGLSVITLFEFVELLADLLSIILLRLRRDRSQIRSTSVRKKSRHSLQITGDNDVTAEDKNGVSVFDLEEETNVND